MFVSPVPVDTYRHGLVIEDRTFDLYIGSDNVTHTLRTDTDTVVAHVMAHNGIDGWTVDHNLTGAWRGQTEQSIMVTVVTDAGTARRVAHAIASALNQESVGIVERGPAMSFESGDAPRDDTDRATIDASERAFATVSANLSREMRDATRDQHNDI